MYELFQKLLDEKGISAYAVGKATGISTATLTSWKQGKYTPKKENLRKITDYFGVDRDYFETGEKFGSVPTFSPDHIELISAYDKLSNADKLAIMQIIKSLSAK